MRVRFLVQVVAVLGVLAVVMPAIAKPIIKTVNFTQQAKMGTAQLTAGEYRLLIDGTKVTVQRGKQVVAEVEGRLEQREAKARTNALVLGPNGEVKEIRFAGDNRVLVISTP